jgi:hypothetical protein
MNFFKIFLFTFFWISLSSGQILHRQSLSSNGVATLTQNGLFVSHTIGQSISSQTVKKSSSIVQQGFQQSLFSKSGFVVNNSNVSIETKVFPNPFISTVTINFSEEILGEIQVKISDMLGRVVFISTTQPDNKSIFIDNLDFLQAGSYFLHLNATNYRFNNQLIKN